MSMKNPIRDGFGLALFFACFAVRLFAQDLAVRSSVDRNVIALGQQFTLSVEISGKSADKASDPQLPGMDPFAAYVGSGSSQNIQLMNGRMSLSRTINYYFMATAVGKYQIGPVQVTAEGKKAATIPISVEIVQGTQPAAVPPAGAAQSQAASRSGPVEGDVFIRAVANKRQVFQNEPVTVSYKLYTVRNIASVGFVKLPATAGFWSEEFAIPQQPVPATEMVEGKKFTVFLIKKLALFPMAPGAKTVEPMVMDCEVQVPRRRSNDPFSDFFDDPFFSSARVERRRIQSNPVTVQVNALPEDGKPRDFSGLVGQFRIRGSVDRTAIQTNEAVSLKIVVEGEGNLRVLKEPPVVLPSDFETYPPKAVESINRSGASISGSKAFEYVMVPRIAGSYEIRPVPLSYFDPSQRRYFTVQTPGWNFVVSQGKGGSTSMPVGLSKEEVRLIGQDIRFIKTNETDFSAIGSAYYRAFWFYGVLVAPLLALGTGVLYRRHRDRLIGDVAYARGRRASRSVRRRFAAAHGLSKRESAQAFYAEMSRAMMGFLGDKLNVAEAGMISADIRNTLAGKGIAEDVLAGYFDCLEVCDRMRFSPSEADEKEMTGFLEKAEKAVSRLDRAMG